MHRLAELVQFIIIPSSCLLGGIFLCLTTFPTIARDLSAFAHDKHWLRLGHYSYDKGRYNSEIITGQFFLSQSGRSSPQQELIATIQAMQLPFNPENSDNHAICQFPARYLWLTENSLTPNTINIFDECTAFKHWVKPVNLQSASIIMVTGYLGNPASTFGHVLLKINNSKNGQTQSLLNQAINYGAIVPTGENGVLYTLYGLFGGYEAGFTTKHVFEENHIYLDKELRDMWEYELNLTRKQLELLVARLWELLGNKYQYYFIDKNCAYRMTELLELVLDINLDKDKRHWHIPANLFFALTENTKIVPDITLIPSRQRSLINRYQLLNETEKLVLQDIVKDEKSNYETLSEKEKIAVADTAIRYYQYKKIDDPESIAIYETRKNDWLLKRLQEPATKSAEANDDNGRLPPTSGHKPSLSKFQIKNSNNHTQLLLGLSVSYHDRLSLQDGRIEDTEFIALDTGVLFEKDNIKLDKFTFAKVAKYLNSQNTMFDSTSISWHIEAGYKRENKIRRFDGLYRSGGLGKSTYIGNNLTFLALNLTTSENTIYTDDVGYKILSGLFFDICNNCTSSLTIDMPLHQSDIIEPRLLLNHRYSFDKNLEGRINFIFEEESILSSELSLFYYW